MPTNVVNWPGMPVPVHPHRWIDNGMIVQALYYTRIADELNLTAYNQRKEALHWGGNFTALAALSSVYIDIDFNPTGVRPRWRTVMRTGHLTDRVDWCMAIAPQNTGGPSNSDPFARLSLTQIGGGFTATADEHWGANETALTNTPDEIRWFFGTIHDVPSDIDVAVQFSDFEGSRLFAGACWEGSKTGTVENGYARRAYGVTQPIYDADRKEQHDLAINLWSKNAAPLIRWCSDTDALAPTRTLTSWANIINDGSSTPDSTSPGVTIDARYRHRKRRKVVDCKMWVFAKNASAAGGDVRLIDIDSNVLGTVSSFNTTGEWKSTDVSFTSVERQYDIQFRGDGSNLFTVMAVVVFPYGVI